MGIERVKEIIASIQTQMEELAKEADAIAPPPPPPSGRRIQVKPGDDLNAAYASLADAEGGEILAEPGDYVTNIEGVERPPDAKPIYIVNKSAAIPQQGTRVTREYLDGMVRIKPRVQTQRLYDGQNRNRNTHFVGVSFHPVYFGYDQVVFGGSKTQTATPDDRARDFSFNRCLWIGDPVNGQHRGLRVNGMNIKVVDSAFYDMFEVGRDSQAIGGWNGSENIYIDNCYLEGGAENVMFGGSDAASPEMLPRNVKILNSRFTKNLAWRQLAAQPSVKCLFELKAVIGFEMRNCRLDTGWKHSWSSGTAFAIKSANQEGSAPFTITQDVLIEDCVVFDTGVVWSLVAQGDGNQPSQRMKNVTIRNILGFNLGGPVFESSGRGFAMTNVPQNLVIDHITNIARPDVPWWQSYLIIGMNANGTVGGPDDLKWTNCLLEGGEYEAFGGGLGTPTFEKHWPQGYKFEGHAIRHHPSAHRIPLPAGATRFSKAEFDASLDDLKRVRPGSAIANTVKTTDGKLPGADVDRLKAVVPDWR